MNNRVNQRIQMLRGIASILIFFSHCSLVVKSDGTNILRWFGAFGVELFIVLSGFLAFKNYEGYVSLKNFYFKKISRFIWLHWFTLVLAIPLCLPFEINKLKILILNASLIHVWIPIESFYFSYNLVSWYLGITLFFIFLPPLIKKRISNFSNRKVYVILAVIQLIEILLVFVSYLVDVDCHWITYICPLTRALDFIAGGFLSIILSRNKIDSCYKKISLLGWICGGMFLMLSLKFDSEVFSSSVWLLPSLLIVLGICGTENTRENSLTFLGNISFELFLFHQLIIRYLKLIMSQENMGSRIAFFITAFIFSVIVSYISSMFTKKIKIRTRLGSTHGE